MSADTAAAPVAVAPTRVDLDEAMVWVPAPVCTWLAPEPANAAFTAAALNMLQDEGKLATTDRVIDLLVSGLLE